MKKLDKEILKLEQYNFFSTNPLLKSTAFLVVSGSHAYGLNTEESDIDLRGFFINSREDYISLKSPIDYFEDQNTDTVLYSLTKFIRLLTKCNPNILELIGAPKENIWLSSECSKYIIENQEIFLSQRVFTTCAGYATDQLRRLQNALSRDNTYPDDIKEQHLLKSILSELITTKEEFSSFDTENDLNLYLDKLNGKEEIFIDCKFKHIPLRELAYLSSKFKTTIHNFSKLNYRNRKKDHTHLCKHASCLIRLLLSGIDILKTGKIRTRLDEHLDLLKSIRFGYMEFEKVFELHNKLEIELQKAKDETKLPENPDYDKINNILKQFIK